MSDTSDPLDGVANMQSELTPEQIETLNTCRTFSDVDPYVFRWIVRRVEWEHRIGTDPQGLTGTVDRIKES